MCTLGICEGVHNEDWNREKSQALDLSIQIQSIKHVVIVQYSRQAEADLGRQGSIDACVVHDMVCTLPPQHIYLTWYL